MSIQEVLRERIRAEGGSLSFAEFVEIALYHPEFGYYTKGPKIGREGDFYTSSHLHPIFGWTLARWILQLWRALEWPPPIHIVEMGPGEGYLALDLLTALENQQVEVRYHLLERSPTLKEREAEVLQGKPVDWLHALSEIPSPAFVLSNELFDAFPFFRVRWTPQGWRELRVIEDRGQFRFQEFALENPNLEAFLERYRPWVRVGQVLDVSPQVLSYATRLFEALQEAVVVTIDYGDRRQALLQRFPQGSLMVYHRHQALEHPFENPGCVDITYHIDFDLLIEAGDVHGAEPVYFRDQGIFLMDIGILAILEEVERTTHDLEEQIKARLAVKTLVYSFGRSHHVLIQSKGVESQRILGLFEGLKRRK